MTVISLLFVISVGFFFTLGLHYGKKLNPDMAPKEVAGKLEESPESIPSRDTLEQASQHVGGAADEAIKEATQEEIKKSGVKTDIPKPVDLPKEKSVAKAPAAVANPNDDGKPVPELAPASVDSSKSTARYAVQLGSYTSRKEAQDKIKMFVKRGIHPEVRTALVDKQLRYRVVLPDFKSKTTANQWAKELKHKRKIENYVVIKDATGSI